MTPPSGWKIEQAMSAWQSARARLLSDDADLANDEALLTAMLGPLEGDVREILARILRAAANAKSMADAADDLLVNLSARRDRYKRRGEGLRGTAFAMMDALGERRVELPDLTASIAAGRPAVVITDENAVPDEYTRTTRTPDKSALLAALKHGEVIPGASLSNGLPTLQIRGK